MTSTGDPTPSMKMVGEKTIEVGGYRAARIIVILGDDHPLGPQAKEKATHMMEVLLDRWDVSRQLRISVALSEQPSTPSEQPVDPRSPPQ